MKDIDIRIFELPRFVTVRIAEKEQTFMTLQSDNHTVVKPTIIKRQDQ
jgi:hypothetical protein